MAKVIFFAEDLVAAKSGHRILDRLHFKVEKNKIFSIIGPRGSGKSSLLRCLNLLFLEKEGQSLQGKLLFDGEDMLSPHFDRARLRRHVSMVFPKPTLFDHITLFENLALPLRLNQVESGADIGEAVEKSLKLLHVWADFKNRLHKKVHSLSPGEQQVLCLARSLTLKPKVVILDEPTLQIEPQFSSHFEQLLKEISGQTTLVFTTSSRKQAARISDQTAFLLNGELIEVGKTSDLFMNPKDTRTEDYLTGRFG